MAAVSIPSADDEAAGTALDHFYDGLRELATPMLFVWGKLDMVLTLASGQRMASRMGRKLDHVAQVTDCPRTGASTSLI